MHNFSAVVSFTNDFGHEHVFPETRPLPLHAWLGQQRTSEGIQTDGDDEDGDDHIWLGAERSANGEASVPLGALFGEHMLPYAIDMPGMMHITDNAAQEITTALSLWTWFLWIVGGINRTLHYYFSRGRLLFACGIRPWARVRKIAKAL